MHSSHPLLIPVDYSDDVKKGLTAPFITFLGKLRSTRPATIAVCQLLSATSINEAETLSNVDAVFIEYSHHPIENFDLLTPVFSKPHVYLHGHYNIINNPKRLELYFPWYFAQACTEGDKNNYSRSAPEYRKERKSYAFSCLNRNPKTERCWFYTKLQRCSFYSQTITSFYSSYTWEEPISLNDLEQYSDKQTRDIFERNVMPFLPICTDEDAEQLKINPGHFTGSISHPAFSDSCVNIISEHSYEIQFLSEKTVKPIAAGQLFLMAGPVGAIKHLEDLGFDVFRDFIDHDYYDNEPNTKLRLLKMLEVAEQLYADNPQDIFSTTYYRREQNKNHLFSEDLQNRIYRPIRQWIQNELNTQ